MRLMLFRQKSQPDVPVPRAELNKVILGSYKDSKKSHIGNLAVALAQDSFCKVLGMELKELVIAPVSKSKIGKLAGAPPACLHNDKLFCRRARYSSSNRIHGSMHDLIIV